MGFGCRVPVMVAPAFAEDSGEGSGVSVAGSALNFKVPAFAGMTNEEGQVVDMGPAKSGGSSWEPGMGHPGVGQPAEVHSWSSSSEESASCRMAMVTRVSMCTRARAPSSRDSRAASSWVPALDHGHVVVTAKDGVARKQLCAIDVDVIGDVSEHFRVTQHGPVDLLP